MRVTIAGTWRAPLARAQPGNRDNRTLFASPVSSTASTPPAPSTTTPRPSSTASKSSRDPGEPSTVATPTPAPSTSSPGAPTIQAASPPSRPPNPTSTSSPPRSRAALGGQIRQGAKSYAKEIRPMPFHDVGDPGARRRGRKGPKRSNSGEKWRLWCPRFVFHGQKLPRQGTTEACTGPVSARNASDGGRRTPASPRRQSISSRALARRPSAKVRHVLCGIESGSAGLRWSGRARREANFKVVLARLRPPVSPCGRRTPSGDPETRSTALGGSIARMAPLPNRWIHIQTALLCAAAGSSTVPERGIHDKQVFIVNPA